MSNDDHEIAELKREVLSIQRVFANVEDGRDIVEPAAMESLRQALVARKQKLAELETLRARGT